MAQGLTIEQLETVWVRLAETLAEVGEAREKLFLAKLALALANAMADPEPVLKAIHIAKSELSRI